MKKVRAKVTFIIYEFERQLLDGPNEVIFTGCIEQIKGDELEHWKTREDGYLFVYSDSLELGYWVSPELVE